MGVLLVSGLKGGIKNGEKWCLDIETDNRRIPLNVMWLVFCDDDIFSAGEQSGRNPHFKNNP